MVIIDTRAPEADAAGHIPGAINIHSIFAYLAASTAEGMATLRQIFADAFFSTGLGGEGTSVYLYCFKSARASNALAPKETGIDDVRLHFGSWNEWSRDESRPIETGLPWM